MLIGRSRRCDLKIESPLVSRRHCRIEPRDSGFFLRDLGSQNGTWIDGEKIDHAFLQAGDRFVAGDVVLRITADGSLEVEGQENPRAIKNPPRLREQAPALAMVLLPLFIGLVAMIAIRDPKVVTNDPPSTPSAVAQLDSPDKVESPPANSPSPLSGPTESASPAATISPAQEGGEGRNPQKDETSPPAEYTLEELLAIAEDCDRAAAEREAEMADLLPPAHAPVTEEAVKPPSLAEAWQAIAGSVPAGELAAASAPLGSLPPPSFNAPSLDESPLSSGPTEADRGQSGAGHGRAGHGGAGGHGGTEVAEASQISPVEGPLLPESARRDLAEAIVDEAIGLIDRYHVRDVSYVPLVPLIDRLRDLDGVPAADGLLALREKTHEHLSTVYRRVRKLEREARQADRDLGKRAKGGADEREDELVLRLAEMVQEHLETLVLIRDRLESALLAEGRPVFLTRALERAIETDELRLFQRSADACVEFECWSAVPALIEGVGSSEAKIRKWSRVTLEKVVGERPGNSQKAWREWWRNAQERRSG